MSSRPVEYAPGASRFHSNNWLHTFAQAMSGERAVWAYIGKVLVALYLSGWIAMRLDKPDTDWDRVGDRIATSWEMVAPRRLLEMGGR